MDQVYERVRRKLYRELSREELEIRCARMELRLSPRFWGMDMSSAWHTNISNLQAAFDALKKA